MKRILLLLFLLPALCLPAQEPWCPQPTNRLVNDYSQKLTSQQSEELEQRLVAFDDSTSNQILILITPTLHDCEIMDLATRIGTTWGVGQKDLKNGVVILIKSRDLDDEQDYGDVALAPGYGLEGALPDLFCNRIINDKMIGPLSEGDYYGAICAALDVIEPVCRGEYSYSDYKDDEDDWYAVLGFIIFFGVIIYVLVKAFKGFGGSGGSSSGGSDGGSYHSGSYWGGFSSGGSSGFGSSSGGFGGFGGGSFGGGGSHGRF